MAYKRVDIPLNAAISADNRRKLFDQAEKITEVFMLKTPSVMFQLSFGPAADLIDIEAPISFTPTGEDQDNGLYATVPVAGGAGEIATLYVSRGGKGTLRPDIETP